MTGIKTWIVVFVAAAVLMGGTGRLRGQSAQLPELKDPISLLVKQIQSGDVKLDYSTNGWGYLPSLLDHLGLNLDSQILVFSKTSFQLSKIAPQTPRAIFFNDSVAVGSVQN